MTAAEDALRGFFRSREVFKELRRAIASGKRFIQLDFERLLERDMELAKLLLDSPKEFFAGAKRAVEELTKIPDGVELGVRGLPETLRTSDIRSGHVGRFIQVEGVITRASEVRPEVKEAAFRCLRCQEMNPIFQEGNAQELQEPFICQNPNCSKRGPFKLEIESTQFADWQSLRIQERPEELRGGRMPQQLDAIARGDLTGVAFPGNHVVLTGTLHAYRPSPKERVMRQILLVNHLEVVHKGVEEAELTDGDIREVEGLRNDPRIRSRIIDSIAPAIQGYEHVKESIALQLFGSDAIEPGGNGTRLRGDLHILLTGDPGVSKSKLLEWVAEISPRGLYTSGRKATAAGLTATAVRDELSRSWSLDAGALVLADGGLCAVDEIEKMDDEDRCAILEALEGQKVSIAKASIVASLNARTSVIAAANPKSGRFDRQRNLYEQIALDPVILSRFDLIFVMRDEPNAERDSAIASHVLGIHRREQVSAPLDPEQLRRLVIYAKREIHPKLSEEEVVRHIREFYVRWRGLSGAGETPPITPRQLEAIIRLSKASARMRFSQRVEMEDVSRAIRLISCFLNEAGVDVETGKLDLDVILTGKPRSQRERMARLGGIIKELEEEYGGAAPIGKIRETGESEGLSGGFIERYLEEEIRRGHLYSPKPDSVTRVFK